MIKTTNSENKHFKDFRKKQEETILKLIEESDYTPIYQRYICGMFTKATDIRYKDDMIIVAEGGQLFLCSMGELHTRNRAVIIVRKIKDLSNHLTKNFNNYSIKKFPCFDEFKKMTKEWLLENWKVQSYTNSIDDDLIKAFKSGNVNITPLTGRIIFEYLFSEEGFDYEQGNIGLAKPGWFVRKYFFLSEDEKLDLKEYALEQLKNGRYSYVLYIVLFLDPDFWAEDFKQTLRESLKGQETLRNMIKVARSVRDESLIFYGKLSDEIEGEILNI